MRPQHVGVNHARLVGEGGQIGTHAEWGGDETGQKIHADANVAYTGCDGTRYGVIARVAQRIARFEGLEHGKHCSWCKGRVDIEMWSKFQRAQGKRLIQAGKEVEVRLMRGRKAVMKAKGREREARLRTERRTMAVCSTLGSFLLIYTVSPCGSSCAATIDARPQLMQPECMRKASATVSKVAG